MIFHAPEVIEKLEEFEIPVMVEHSSYEQHPLGRVEWVKFYGALLGKKAQAEEIFKVQAAILDEAQRNKQAKPLMAKPLAAYQLGDDTVLFC